MKLLAITDLHDKRAALERILQDAGLVDLVLLGGDLTNFGGPNDAEKLVRRAQQSGQRVWAVAGNCDSAEIERRLVDLEVSLHGRGVVLDRVGLHGLSGMPPWRTGMYHFTEDQIAAALRSGQSEIGAAQPQHHVVLAHCPPRNERIDRTHWGDHVGSTALRAFIDQVQPELVLCGHIHEGRGIELIGRTTVVNCGPAAAGSYAFVEIGDQLTIELREA